MWIAAAVRSIPLVFWKGLQEEDLAADPLDMFNRWYGTARKVRLPMPNAMCLSTADADGAPSSRMVLLKGHDKEGFIFYTNYGSRKAAEMEANPRVSLLFHWHILQRQVRINGSVSRVAPEVSDQYFQSRPAQSRLGAWASRQSETVESRELLQSRYEDAEKQFSGKHIPCPEFWGGYCVKPESYEFWQGRAYRLHDRFLYTPAEISGWTAARLFP